MGRIKVYLKPYYIAKKGMFEINEQTTTKVEYPINANTQIKSSAREERQ